MNPVSTTASPTLSAAPASRPTLSVVIVPVGDTAVLRAGTQDLAGTLEALKQQVGAPTVEIIVPYHDGLDGVEARKAEHPEVTFLYVPVTRQGMSREHHDILRARGAAAARGELVACLEDHVRPAPDWAAQVVQAHRQTFDAIGGAIENGVDRPLNWAVYFLDLGKYQNPLPAGESANVSTVHVAYKRVALAVLEPEWRDGFNETRLHAALRARGGKLALEPRMVVYQHRSGLSLRLALTEFFVWGRSYARIRSGMVTSRQRLVMAAFAPLLPAVLLARMAQRAWARRRTVGAFLKALPFTALLTASWALGEWAGYLAGPVQPARPTEPNLIRET